MATTIFAAQALTAAGWRQNVTVKIGNDGLITDIFENSNTADHRVGILLPALSNVHSHTFQRAMGGLAERQGPQSFDDFWTWRKVMYRFLELLTPEDVEAIAAQVHLEMIKSGYAASGEFHYVHHDQGGRQYAQIEELSLRHFSAALQSGIGYTHLPVLYMQGGLDGSKLQGGQLRFGNNIDQFESLYSKISANMGLLPNDSILGIAPHSLRAVTIDGLRKCIDIAPNGPIHIHAAEQVGEVKEVSEHLGSRPIRWLLDNMPVDKRWCLIHATHMDSAEIMDFALSGAVAGLCPITEANLGDGIFEASQFMRHGGTFGIGADSNVKIALSEELRMLEVSQRLRDQKRVVLRSEKVPSNGRYLYEEAARGGAQALGRNAGRIEIGALADLVALDDQHCSLAELKEDAILDTWIFSCNDNIVSDVWSAGRHVLCDRLHIREEQISSRFLMTIKKLRRAL
ncbi:MAG: formimidoylglutamate deiminase [Glaciecola sp.]|jgi:formimidoylglutamate deiminase